MVNTLNIWQQYYLQDLANYGLKLSKSEKPAFELLGKVNEGFTVVTRDGNVETYTITHLELDMPKGIIDVEHTMQNFKLWIARGLQITCH